MKLDYSIDSPEERKQLVERIIAETPDISPAYLEILADYLVVAAEKKERKILTENRLATINKRERSLEGLAAQLENGEDGVYSFMTEDKNAIFQPKISITQEDLNSIPFLAQLKRTIDDWEIFLKQSIGHKKAYLIKKALIEMRKDQYVIKQAYQKPIVFNRITHSSRPLIRLDDTSYMDGQTIVVQGVSLMNPQVVSAVLCDYSNLKENSWGQFDSDTWYFLQVFEDICDKALADFPIYQRIVQLKIDKLQNADIQSALQAEFNQTYSIEYISSLWRKKIPKLIANAAIEDFITWEYTSKGYPMKTCSKCGQTKPAHNQFFSKNKTSKDSLYSICKKCRNKKRGD